MSDALTFDTSRPTAAPLRAGRGREVVLRAKGLSKSFGGQAVLDEVSVQLRRGEVVLLRGANGAGKTTLLNILSGIVEPDAGRLMLRTDGGEEVFHFPRPWWAGLNFADHFTPERVAREGVGRTWQDIRLFSTQTLLDNIAVAAPAQIGENPAWAILRRPAVRRQEDRLHAEATAILADLGLREREFSSADRISLGQSKRVAIARAVQAGARLLLLDEPLAGLDSPGIAEVMQLLERLAHQDGLTLVIVEHIFNIPRILEFASTVWTLADGRVTIATPDQVERGAYASGNAELKAWLEETSGSVASEDLELPGGALLTTITHAQANSNPSVLEVRDLVVHRGNRLVIGKESEGRLQGISFTLRQGQIGILQAPNGWGKTTLMEAISGLLPPTSGTIHFEGKPLDKLAPWQRSNLGISLLQARGHTFPGLTVQETLELAGVNQIPESIRPWADRRASSLSGGEKQRVALICAMDGRPFRLGLLDEPFSALDRDALADVRSMALERLHAGLLIAIPGNSGAFRSSTTTGTIPSPEPNN